MRNSSWRTTSPAFSFMDICGFLLGSWAALLRVGCEVEVEAGMVLKFEAALHAVLLASNDDQWGHEPDNLELFAKLLRVPDLSVLSLKSLAASRGGVDLGQAFSANVFGRVRHGKSGDEQSGCPLVLVQLSPRSRGESCWAAATPRA